MKYYKTTIDGYVFAVSTGNGQTEITEEEYNSIMAIIMSAPEDPEGFGYRLRADNLEWEMVEFPPDPPDPDPELDDVDALEILLGGAGE